MLATILERSTDARVRLLVRPDHVDSASRHLDDAGVDRDRVMLLSGDVVSVDLGLSGTEYLDLIAHTTDVFHIASIWYLGVNRKQTRAVNVLGARNVLDAASEMKNLRRLNHFSTAFVAGDRTGVIMEEELDEGQRLRNAYEETKHEAERLMRRAMSSLPISVYRPSIIVGDSATGEIDKLAGPYYLMSAIVMMPPNIPMVLPGRGDKPLNMVPIDYVTEAMWRIGERDDTAGRTFHLCDPNPLSARKVFELVAERVGKRAPISGTPMRLARLLMRIPYVEKLTRSPRQFLDDFNQLSIYNSMHTLDAIGDELHCPPFPSYVDQLIDYIRASDSNLDVDMPSAEEMLG